MLWFKSKAIYDEAIKCPPVILGGEDEVPLRFGEGTNPYSADWHGVTPSVQPDGSCVLNPCNWSDAKEAEFVAAFSAEIAKGDIALEEPRPVMEGV